MIERIEIGDLVVVSNFCDPINIEPIKPPRRGLVVGFNKKGEGGRDFVHVFVDGDIEIFFTTEVSVIGYRHENW